MPVPSRRRARLAVAALVAVPALAAAGCGAQTVAAKESVQASLQKASASLRDSQGLSLTFHLTDPQGKMEAAAPTDADRKELVTLLGSTISVTVEPVSGTLGQTGARDLPPSQQLQQVDLALAVTTPDGALAQARLVHGDLYLSADLDQLSSMAGPDADVQGGIDRLSQESPDELAPLLQDVRAGKWAKVSLVPFADAVDKRATASPSGPVDLLGALKPYTTVTDASSTGGTRVLDVKVKAKLALEAVLQVLRKVSPALGTVPDLDASALDRLSDGTLNGQVTLKDDHLRKVTLDLQSAVKLAPAGDDPAPDLTGATLTVDVDDAAPPVEVPANVSSVDLSSLLEDAIAAAGTQS